MRFITLTTLALVFGSGTQAADALAKISNMRMWDAPDSTRLVFDLSQSTGFSVFTLKNPDRVVIDIENTQFDTSLPPVSAGHPLLKQVRSSARNSSGWRFVLDVKNNIRPRSFMLNPNEEYGHRLVVDMDYPLTLVPPTVTEAEPSPKPETPKAETSKPKANKTRDIVVAIDAGHGGEDPGAHGRSGTREKDVTLAIARKLKAMIDSESGMRGVLIRDGDYYVSLRKRIQRARQHKADLFISVHADAFTHPYANGSSVYVLSAKGASDEASRWLAERENAADLIGGVSLDDKDDVLAQVLLDLSMTGTIDVSTRMAERVLDEFKTLGPVHKPSVQYARFVVLKSPDIPSMLVETAFISNPAEEKRLRDASHQEKVASAILRGVRAYFQGNPPADSTVADNEPPSREKKG